MVCKTTKVRFMAHMEMMARWGHNSCNNQHSSPWTLSQCKHRIFSVIYIGNCLLARLAPLCCFLVWDLEVFGELPISSCEMSVVASLFTPICCFQLMLLVPTLLVDLATPKPVRLFPKIYHCCKQSSIVTSSKDCLSH